MVSVEPGLYERTDVTFASYGNLLVLSVRVVGVQESPGEEFYRHCCKEVGGSRVIWAETATMCGS